MESSSSDSRAPPRLTTFLRAHFRERSGDKKGDDVDRYWYASDVDEAYVARAKQMGEEEGGFNNGSAMTKTTSSSSFRQTANKATKNRDSALLKLSQVALKTSSSSIEEVEEETRLALESVADASIQLLRLENDLISPEELLEAPADLYAAVATNCDVDWKLETDLEDVVEYSNAPELERKKVQAKRRGNEREAFAFVKAQLGGALSESGEAVQRWKDFWQSANALRRRGGSMGTSNTGGDLRGATVEVGKKKESYYGEDLFFVPPKFYGANEFETSSHQKASGGLESAILSSMTRGLDSANAFASLELERSRTPSFHELDALGNESEASTSLQGGSGSILSWLREQCEIFRENNQNSDAFAGWTDICGNICRVCLNSSSSDDQVASELFDLLGDGGFDLVASVCERRGQLADAIRRRLQALKEAFDPEESAQDDYAKSRSAVSVRSTTDVAMEKIRKKEERRNKRRAAGGHGEYLLEWFTNDSGLGFGAFCDDSLPLPNRNEAAPGSVDDILNSLRGLGLGTDGGKKALPPGTTRKVLEGYEEIYVPARIPDAVADGELQVSVSHLPVWAQTAFKGIQTFNRIQSKIFECAYTSNENVLVCAPTGAGKTNIAMLCAMQEIAKHFDEENNCLLEHDDFKIVYVAPMKALAAEVTRTFQKRLDDLGMVCRELTGDTQLSKRELEETHVIVTTPEKWDVITRKGGEVSVASTLRLLIIDEVHLLNDERGPVIETLVARTRRQVEQTQSMIRIVGLSATLPNPRDVARFLGVAEGKGLFVFDQSYRPIPLTQVFIGVSETNAMKRQNLTIRIAFKKACDALRKGKQAMVFVHSRKDTVKTARQLAEIAGEEGELELFENDTHEEKSIFAREVSRSRNQEMKELFFKGFGCHNAGMLRKDRTLVEQMFAAGVIKVLVCTATLAWGVNLPAHQVIIKGTQLYDASAGGFKDLGVLDVQQIFGRAGRPGFDTSGEGVIITEHKKLTKYVAMLTHSTPIESQFIECLADNLNAEIVLGTVTNVREGAQWLSYSYLHTRMEQNPLGYALTWDEVRMDPGLIEHRRNLIKTAARKLHKAKMIRFDEQSGQLYQTEAGRIASHFYIKVASMELFEEMMNRHMSLPEVLHVISHSSEFENIAPREDEMPELEALRRNRRSACPIEIKGDMSDKVAKVNLLLQVYVSRKRLESFSLVADSSYISQNASRICRALFELMLKRGWPSLAETLLTLSKAVDRRLWPHHSPLRQFENTLKPETIYKLEEKDATVDRLIDMSAKEVGDLLRLNAVVGAQVKRCVEQLPHVNLEAVVRPITRSVLRVSATLTPEFMWRDEVHGQTQQWLIWVEDPVNEHIYHTETFTLSKKQYKEGRLTLAFTIPIFDPRPPQYFLRATHLYWLGCESFLELDLEDIVLPTEPPPNTELLDLDPLPRSALNNPTYESLYVNKFTHFNAIQTQAFHTLYHTNHNVLLGAPTGSGKTISSELTILKMFRDEPPGSKVVYIAPLKALVRERVDDWKKHFCPTVNKKMVELTGDYTPDLRALLRADIIVATPEKWDGISRNWQSRSYVSKVKLVVIDEIHLLGADRGPILEAIVSRMNYISARTKSKIRIVGLSTALANARDLGDWLGIENDKGLFNFRPSVRPVPLECHIQGFPGKFYCPRMLSMNKPTYAAIRTHSPLKPALVFVSSRRQTRLTALDLIAYAAADENPNAFVHCDSRELEERIAKIQDPALKHTLQFGIGLHHAGLSPEDRGIAEQLFAECKIQVLVSTSTLAWGVNLPAHLVVIKGTEFYDGKTKRYQDFPITDVLQMMGRAGRPQFDKSGCCVVLVHEPKKNFYKKFLYEPFPVESCFNECLEDHFNAEVVGGAIKSKQDAVDYLTWTYFFRRAMKNPTYYNLEDTNHETVNAYLSEMVETTMDTLANAKCLAINDDDDSIKPLMLGRIASFYYLNFKTMAVFSKRLKKSNTLEDVLTILCDVAEYDEIPVRHNEDKLNSDLAINVLKAGGYRVDRRAYDDPHVKASLLFQAHFLRLPLPMSDYHTDTKSVLDQSQRILQAMTEIVSEAGWLSTALSIMNLSQMIIQGLSIYDNSLLLLPKISEEEVSKLERFSKITCLPQLVFLAVHRKTAFFEAMSKCGLSKSKSEAIFQVCANLPLLDVKATLVEDKVNCSDGRRNVSVKVSLKRSGKKTGRKTAPRAYAPRFPKQKDEGWWIVLGEKRNTGELVAMRRAQFADTFEAVLKIDNFPRGMNVADITVFIMSDTYIGLDQEASVGNTDDKRFLSSTAIADRHRFFEERDSDSEPEGNFWQDEEELSDEDIPDF